MVFPTAELETGGPELSPRSTSPTSDGCRLHATSNSPPSGTLLSCSAQTAADSVTSDGWLSRSVTNAFAESTLTLSSCEPENCTSPGSTSEPSFCSSTGYFLLSEKVAPNANCAWYAPFFPDKVWMLPPALGFPTGPSRMLSMDTTVTLSSRILIASASEAVAPANFASTLTLPAADADTTRPSTAAPGSLVLTTATSNSQSDSASTLVLSLFSSDIVTTSLACWYRSVHPIADNVLASTLPDPEYAGSGTAAAARSENLATLTVTTSVTFWPVKLTLT